MKPVFQTTFYDPDTPAGKQRGNCWTACIASLLELNIKDVPNFVEIDEIGGQDWWTHTLQWLHERGRILIMVLTDDPGDGPYIQCGLSPRSPKVGDKVYHSVIYRNGELLHDPHPDGTGVLELDSAFRILEGVYG